MRLAIALILTASAVYAAPLKRELGLNLRYYRLHSVPEDLPAANPGKEGACVVDIRYLQCDENAARQLDAWIGFNASPKTPLFILANAQTARSVLIPFANHDVADVITVGPPAAGFTPDIPIFVDPATDRRAYEALDKGATIESLTQDLPDKARVDEAMLSREHLSDSEALEPTPDDTPAKPRPLIDAVLQRAIQLHRGLLALKRI